MRGQHLHPLHRARSVLDRPSRKLRTLPLELDDERRLGHAEEARPFAAAADRDERRDLESGPCESANSWATTAP